MLASGPRDSLVFAKDSAGRRAIDVARPNIRAAMERAILMKGRYLLDPLSLPYPTKPLYQSRKRYYYATNAIR